MAGFALWGYRRVIRPLMFLLSPDKAHSLVISMLSVSGKTPGVPALTKVLFTRRHRSLEVEWKGMKFSSPVGLSAGLDKNGQIVPMMRALGFGFSEVGSVTAEICKGNDRPWFYRLPKTGSLVVHVGLANQGVKRILQRLHAMPENVQKNYPTILSVARTNSEDASGVEEGVVDYVASVKAAKKSPAVQMVEVNISCPNAFGGQTYTTPELLDQLLSAIDAVKLKKPLFIKMPVDLSWPKTKQLLKVAVAHGVTGVTLSNLTKQREKVEFLEPLPDTVRGGLSGAPLRERSTELVAKTYRAYGDKLVIIGVGGVMSAEDAYDKIKAGATFVALVTGLIMKGPLVEEINSGLVKLLKADGYTHISQAVGTGK